MNRLTIGVVGDFDLLASACEGSRELPAEYFCSFETNRVFESRWQAAGIRFSARSPQGEPRALELQQHPFFVATLFQPQLTSTFVHPHPIILGFLKACLAA